MSTKSSLRTIVTGVGGRMGAVLVRTVQGTPGLQLVGATERSGSPLVGKDAGLAAQLEPLRVPVAPGLRELLQGADVVIDFTTPEASAEHARACAEAGTALVVGTTGLTPEVKAVLAQAARRVPIVAAPNMSIGVNLVVQVAAQLAARLGEGFDVEVLETHHRMKKDAPSGTALWLAQSLAASLGRAPEDVRTTRAGLVGERPAREIGVQALRGGDVVGEHTVFFFGDGERVELTHRAMSREHFARGAVRAAAWTAGRAPGLYDMSHVLAE